MFIIIWGEEEGGGNQTSEEYLQIAKCYPPERNRDAVLKGEYLNGRCFILIAVEIFIISYVNSLERRKYVAV
jgi:hypothetical protein